MNLQINLNTKTIISVLMDIESIHKKHDQSSKVIGHIPMMTVFQNVDSNLTGE